MRGKILFTVVLLVAALALSACTQGDKTGAENKALAERFVDEVWNSGNVALIDETVATTFVRHNPNSWDPPMIRGLQEFKDYVTRTRTDFGNFHVAVDERFAEGDMVAATWTVTATHNETGKPANVKGISISRFSGGKLAEEWVTWDTHGLMQQLGMVAEPETTMK